MKASTLALLAAAVLNVYATHRTDFVVKSGHFGEGAETVHLKVLYNQRTGEYLEVSPGLGGRTERLVLRSRRGLREVLLNHKNASAAAANVGWKGDLLMPYANRVRNGTYSLGGKTHHLERNEDLGKYGKGALHGYLWKKVMKVLNTRADNSSAQLVLGWDFDGQDPGYPFPLSVEVTYTLDATGMTLGYMAKHRGINSSDRPLPLTASWHSYFAVSEVAEASVELDHCTKWNHVRVTNDSNTDSDLIPTGRYSPFSGFDGRSPVGGLRSDPNYWDDEFKATASKVKCPTLEVRVRDHPGSKEAAVLWMDSNFRWVQVFTGTVRKFGEQGIAVEAMSGEADAFNNGEGLLLLQPGEVWQASIGVRLEPGHALLESSNHELLFV